VPPPSFFPKVTEFLWSRESSPLRMHPPGGPKKDRSPPAERPYGEESGMPFRDFRREGEELIPGLQKESLSSFLLGESLLPWRKKEVPVARVGGGEGIDCSRENRKRELLPPNRGSFYSRTVLTDSPGWNHSPQGPSIIISCCFLR